MFDSGRHKGHAFAMAWWRIWRIWRIWVRFRQA